MSSPNVEDDRSRRESLERAGWVERSAVDANERTIRWYRAIEPRHHVPLVLWVQGSGYSPLFTIPQDGPARGGYQNILRGVAKPRLRVIAVEKPGVVVAEQRSGEGGTSFHASAEFRREHTLDRWVDALEAAVLAALVELSPPTSPLVVIGHSEGAIAAAALAGRVPGITHAGLLGCGGMTGFGERYLAELSRTTSKAPEGLDVSKDESAQQDAATLVRSILEDPDSSERFAWGHPFRRWAGFGTFSAGEALSRTRTEVFLAHGLLDRQVPLASFAALAGRLWAAGKNPRIHLAPGADHGFRTESSKGPEGMQAVLQQIVDWARPACD